ncbi:hypothetical protein BT93_L5834 [Corymbia citriodora subsp. variegata]|uniref:intramembrane prenyl-peptidase Rce1 n=1 Tax=Corymbia citriodora subsp. variegata TaxID=360336 RepID=A0A8T0CJ11_CORYI|nr:hypothetical protein BT93_L5834 [Corymbia citriodora subsp. variegata]
MEAFATAVEPSGVSSTTAILLSITYTLLYVLPFYLLQSTRPTPTLDRDSPGVIRSRIRSVSITVILSNLLTFYVLITYGHYSVPNASHLLGLYPVSLSTLIRPLALTALLFLGPLYLTTIVHKSISPFRALKHLRTWQGTRNYIAGPLTEELLFRSAIIPLHILANYSSRSLILLTPLYFGIAHIHHLYEFRLTHPSAPVAAVLARTLFQFAFTTVFGWYASFVFLRTGCVWSVVLVHAFCNWMGFPKLWGKVRVWDEKQGKLVDGGRTVVYYVLLVAGLASFIMALRSRWDLGGQALVKL